MQESGFTSSTVLDLVRLAPLMGLTQVSPEIGVALIDGPVQLPPDLQIEARDVPMSPRATCVRPDSAACIHGTAVVGILFAKRDSGLPAICPNCTLLLRPIFFETMTPDNGMPTTTAQNLADAITECVDAGARVLNMSVGVIQTSVEGERRLQNALDYAARHEVIPVVAAGNEGTVGSTVITRHSWAIPVASCDLLGRPTFDSTLGHSVGRNGLLAPGQNISTLSVEGVRRRFGGTSAATAFVTGTIALLLSQLPSARASRLKASLLRRNDSRRTTIVPPLLDAWGGVPGVF